MAQDKWEPTQKYSVYEDDVSTDYSDIESDSEQEQEQIEPKQEKQEKQKMDPRLKILDTANEVSCKIQSREVTKCAYRQQIFTK